MKSRKHGEKVYRWRYKWSWENNPVWTKNDYFQEKNVWVQTSEKVYIGTPYRFRVDPVTCGYKKGGWPKKGRSVKGGGTPWKKAFIGDLIYQKEIRQEYGVTFTMPDKIDYKICADNQRSWKRTKKPKQWM